MQNISFAKLLISLLDRFHCILCFFRYNKRWKIKCKCSHASNQTLIISIEMNMNAMQLWQRKTIPLIVLLLLICFFFFLSIFFCLLSIHMYRTVLFHAIHTLIFVPDFSNGKQSELVFLMRCNAKGGYFIFQGKFETCSMFIHSLFPVVDRWWKTVRFPFAKWGYFHSTIVQCYIYMERQRYRERVLKLLLHFAVPCVQLCTTND